MDATRDFLDLMDAACRVLPNQARQKRETAAGREAEPVGKEYFDANYKQEVNRLKTQAANIDRFVAHWKATGRILLNKDGQAIAPIGYSLTARAIGEKCFEYDPETVV